MNSRRSFLLDEDLAIRVNSYAWFSCRSVKGGMWMFPIILHSCMCGFMTLAPMHLEASCRFRCDDENGSAPTIGQCTPQ